MHCRRKRPALSWPHPGATSSSRAAASRAASESGSSSPPSPRPPGSSRTSSPSSPRPPGPSRTREAAASWASASRASSLPPPLLLLARVFVVESPSGRFGSYSGHVLLQLSREVVGHGGVDASSLEQRPSVAPTAHLWVACEVHLDEVGPPVAGDFAEAPASELCLASSASAWGRG